MRSFAHAAMKRRNSYRASTATFLTVGLLAVLTGCGKLLEVTLPTRVPAAALDNAALANTLVLGAVGDFECAYNMYVPATGVLTDEMWHSSGWNVYIQWDGRRIYANTGDFATSACEIVIGYGVYTPLQTARFQAEDAATRIAAFSDADVPDKSSLLATAEAYEAYGLALLGEAFCAAAVDVGPLMQPPEVLALAEQHFTKAITLAQTATNTDILNMALVGRARVRLTLGKKAEAEADAKLVPPTYVKNATRSGATQRRFNKIWADNYSSGDISVDPSFRNVTFAGKPDPRVTVFLSSSKAMDGTTPLYQQMKYTTVGSPIPIARGTEAQLIIAEVEGGQTAVDIINRLHTAVGLAPFSSTSPDEIAKQVIEERRREFFLEGHRLNDLLRLKLPFPSGTNHDGVAFGPTTCLPVPQVELDGNPNIKQ